MTTEPDWNERLRALVEVLGTRDWRRVAEAERDLLAAGLAGAAAVMAGLSHPRPRVRRGCAGFFDHHGTDACVPGLTRALLDDPVANVRREAVHSLACDRCKAAPLGVDAVPLLIERVENDPSAKVRAEAVFGLTRQPREAVAALAPPVLRRLLADPDEDARVKREAHLALRLCDPAYRAETDARARERSAAGRA